MTLLASAGVNVVSQEGPLVPVVPLPPVWKMRETRQGWSPSFLICSGNAYGSAAA